MTSTFLAEGPKALRPQIVKSNSMLSFNRRELFTFVAEGPKARGHESWIRTFHAKELDLPIPKSTVSALGDKKFIFYVNFSPKNEVKL